MNSEMLLLHKKTGSVGLDERAIQDLELYPLLAACLETQKREQIARWLADCLTDDPTELARRGALLLALLELPDAQRDVRALLRLRDELRYCLERLYNPRDRLLYCTYAARCLRLFAESMNAALTLLRRSDRPAMQEQADRLRRLSESEACARERRRYSALSQVFAPPKSAVLGVNVQPDYTAEMFGVVGAVAEALPADGIFHKGAPFDSLLSYTQVPRSTQLDVLERRLYAQIEKQWRAPLAQAFACVKTLNVPLLRDWLDALDDWSFFAAGLKLAHLFRKNELPLCAAAVSEEGVEVETFFPPWLSLTAGRPVSPYTLRFRNDEAVLIAGQNRSGKTVLLCGLAQGIVLAQLGFLLPARSFRYSVRTSIASLFTAGEADTEQSRFQWEIDQFWELQPLLGAQSLMLLNEPFTSTNYEESLDITVQAVETLLRQRCGVLLVTNVNELYDALRERCQDRLRCFEMERRDDQSGLTSYRALEQEPSHQSYAQRILEEYGVSGRDLLLDEQALAALEKFREAVVACDF